MMYKHCTGHSQTHGTYGLLTEHLRDLIERRLERLGAAIVGLRRLLHQLRRLLELGAQLDAAGQPMKASRVVSWRTSLLGEAVGTGGTGFE